MTTTETDTSSASEPSESIPHNPQIGSAAETSGSDRPRLFGVLWALHWLLRIGLAVSLLPYAWTKVFHVQMGYADYADAIVQYGEMSPMGLLWRFMAFSPTVQLLAGLAELIAVILLLFRRTAWLGALIAALDMSVVFLLNLTFDVPVKQLSGAMALVGLILLIPNVPRVAKFLLGRSVGPAVSGLIWRNRTFVRITRWISPALAVVIIVGSGVASGLSFGWGRTSGPEEISGVYTVTAEGEPAKIDGTGHTTDDITQIAFGQVGSGKGKRMSIRYADGDFQDGLYSVDGSSLTAELYPIREGAQTLIRDASGTLEFDYEDIGDGTYSLKVDDSELTIKSDEERRFLFDRGFRWGPEAPVNR
ncbi:DoxX family protein [Brevibacterium spongiae]|uniref:DoxX family protein n=1 Tax=Brevibacterium spongiae TaxID=2909672 RepID=A0ABY5SQF8_9MICO|nr:DoxX family protein [Brevibacterium spongiae]UVI36777.1 DoxX family protein [Brevibacterium spongiae]